MAYLGQPPLTEFTNPPTKDSFTGDGSATVFDMASEVPSAAQFALEVFIDNVRQEPGAGKAFTLGVDGSGDHKRVTFTAAPANGASIYVINDKTNQTIVAPLSNDLNGTELILDVDGDTSITADTDDRIDLKIGNVEHISFGNSSGDTIIKPMTDAKDIMFRQFDGRDVLEINDAGFVALHNGTTGPGQLRLYEDDDNGSNFTAFQVGTQSADITYTLPTADGSSGQAITTNGSGVLTFSTVATALDDIPVGDAAATLATTAGNITIDAQGNDTDIIFKGTDGGADRTFMTIDGSAGGDLFLTGGLIDLKNDGSAVSQIKFYCESSNAHAQTLIGAPHSESASNTLTLPSTGGDSRLLSATSTATVTNKTLTSPKINENVAVTSTASELNILDGATVVVAEINALDIGSTAVGTAVASKAVILDSSKDYTGIRNLTITGEIDAATGDFSGAVDIAGATTVVGLTASGAILPAADDATDLGSASKQFRNIYTGDLHLSNMSKAAGNVVDGTKGDWTIQEGAEELYLMNNNSGKKYKFNLTEV